MTENIPTHGVAASTEERHKSIRIMANSMFRQLKSNGYSRSHIIDFTSELLQLLTDSLQGPTPADTSLTSESLAKELLP